MGSTQEDKGILSQKEIDFVLEVARVRKEVQKFSVEMEEVLKANDHKGGWEDCSIEYLFFKLIEEVGEVSKILQWYVAEEAEVDEIEAEKAHKECVDIANVAMMLASKFK